MTIRLKPEVEALIERDVQRGSYQSSDDFVEGRFANSTIRKNGWRRIGLESLPTSKMDMLLPNEVNCSRQKRSGSV
jgi:hypothetical protein